MQKSDRCLILSKRSYYSFAPYGFVTRCLLIINIDEVKNFATTSSSSWCVSHVLGDVHIWLVTYWDPCKKGGIHILKSSKVLKWWKVSAVSSSTGIIESRDKSFVLDLKLLFTIVDCFSGRFPLRFFTVKLFCFIGFPRSSYLILFIFLLHDFDMILMLFLF